MRVFQSFELPGKFQSKAEGVRVGRCYHSSNDHGRVEKNSGINSFSHRINLIKILWGTKKGPFFYTLRWSTALHLSTSNWKTLLGKFSSLDVLGRRVGRYFLRACQRNFRLAWNAAAADDRELELSSSRERIRYAREPSRLVSSYVISSSPYPMRVSAILVRRVFANANVAFSMFRYATHSKKYRNIFVQRWIYVPHPTLVPLCLITCT